MVLPHLSCGDDRVMAGSTDPIWEQKQSRQAQYRCCQRIPHGLQYIQVSSFSSFLARPKNEAQHDATCRENGQSCNQIPKLHVTSAWKRGGDFLFLLQGLKLGKGGWGRFLQDSAFVQFVLVFARAKTYNSEHLSIPMQQASLHTQDPI